MNVDRILATCNEQQVDYLLIGGMNFLLRHEPVLTYDVDLWVDDTAENLKRTEAALVALDAEWGPTEATWRHVRDQQPGWLRKQAVFCLASPHGALDVFRGVRGLPSWTQCRQRAVTGTTSGGVPYVGLSDADMLACQLALTEADRKVERIRVLQAALSKNV